MEKIRAAVIGLGFAGNLHIDAIRRIGKAEVVAVMDSDLQMAKRKAEEYGIADYYNNIDEMLKKSQIDVIHNCTPNHLHAEINEMAIRRGIHLFSEKPLTRTAEEAEKVMALLRDHPEVAAGVNYCYRMNPMVWEMKQMVEDGTIGLPRLVHGSYLQDHLLYETDYSWRMDPAVNGPSRAMADIGTHWMDTVQYVLGGRITEVCADLVTIMPKRKKPLVQAATFAVNESREFEKIDITTEDFGSVLFKMDTGVSGVFYVSQVSAGRGCFLNFEIDGSESSLYWNQEKPNQVWMGNKERPNCELDRNPVSLSREAQSKTRLAKGHPEGWNDALYNNISSFYQYIEKRDPEKRKFTTFEEALYLMRLVEAILESSKLRRWIKVTEVFKDAEKN